MHATMGTALEPRAYDATPAPGRADLHLLNRMGFGWSVSAYDQVRAAGGGRPWFSRQLDPASVEEDPFVAEIDSWFPSRLDSMETRLHNNSMGIRMNWQYATDFVNWTTLRRIFSRRQVLETMVDFWSHHFHIPAMDDNAWVARQLFDDVIRTHALGRFDDLLHAVTLHPAMLVFLDNFRNVRDRPNENHGRELLELHTVGSAAGYTEPMVRDSAVILSGWSVNLTNWIRRYKTSQHTLGPVEVLGFSDPNASEDGRSLTGNYLHYLAFHPATARSIARKLALRFVGDQPSTSLVDQLAAVFLQSGTSIPATLRALVSSSEFAASYDAKVRTPVDDLVATARALQVRPTKPLSGLAFANNLHFAHGGEALYSWPRPDGAPLQDEHWCSASRMLGSYRMHWNLAGRLEPTEDVVYRTPASWLPEPELALDLFVDHLSRLLLGRPSTGILLQAACQATGLTPDTVITPGHPLVKGGLTPLLAVFLDSPEHMRR